MASAPRNPTGTSWQQLLTGVTIISSSLLLGSFFNHWLIDYNAIWINNPTSTLSDEKIRAALAYYSSFFPGTTWYTAYLGTLATLAIGSTAVKVTLNFLSGMLFDGASFMLLLSAFAMYLTNVQAALEFLPLGAGREEVAAKLAMNSGLGEARVREALQSLAASNMIISVSLTGVLYLQAAQAYSEKKQPALETVKVITPKSSSSALSPPSSPNPARGRSSAVESSDGHDSSGGGLQKR